MTVLRNVSCFWQGIRLLRRAAHTTVRATLALALFVLLPMAGLRAEDQPPPPPWREMSVGADVADNVWLLYSGVTLAPLGEIHQDGMRLRSGGGYGKYRYSGHRSGKKQQYEGTITYIEALVGYQAQFGPLTAKAFVGVAAIDQAIAPFDPFASAQGLDYGAKGSLELWLNIGSTAWTSLDASWTSAHLTYSGRWRLGYRLAAPLSVGLEGGFNGNALEKPMVDGRPSAEPERSSRVGVFARYEWGGNEISASAGLSRNAWDVADDVELRDAYATVNYLMRY